MADHVAFAREMVSVTISWAVVRSVLVPVAVYDVLCGENGGVGRGA